MRFLHFKIFSASFLIKFLSPGTATSINMCVPFLLSRNMMSGELLGIVLSFFTCWFCNIVTLPLWLASTDFGTLSYQCSLYIIIIIIIIIIQCLQFCKILPYPLASCQPSCVGLKSYKFYVVLMSTSNVASVLLSDALQRLMPSVVVEVDILPSKSELPKRFYSVVQSLSFHVNCGYNLVRLLSVILSVVCTVRTAV